MADFQVRRAQVHVLSEWALQLRDGVPRVSKDGREGSTSAPVLPGRVRGPWAGWLALWRVGTTVEYFAGREVSTWGGGKTHWRVLHNRETGLRQFERRASWQQACKMSSMGEKGT